MPVPSNRPEFHALPPSYKKLNTELQIFHEWVFRVDAKLRRFGQGYFAIGGRPYEFFVDALGYARGDDEVDVEVDLAELMGANARMQSAMHSAYNTARNLPAELKGTDRSKSLINAVNQGYALMKALADRVRPIVQQHNGGCQREFFVFQPLPVE